MERGNPDEENGSTNKGKMWALDQSMDQPLGPESWRIQVMMDGRKKLSTSALLFLAFKSLGIVYGDLGTSPLYVYRSTFPDGLKKGEHEGEILGALSLIIFTLSLIPLIKYMFIVLKADDNGEGGTFALYSLLCRYCSISSLPSRHPTDEELTTYSKTSPEPNSRAEKMKTRLEKSRFLQLLLLILVLLSTCMVIGDGILTPAISVVSAVDGVKVASKRINQTVVVVISAVILIMLFSMQRFGTNQIGFLFAPVVLVWFITNGTIGIYNIVRYDHSVFRAFSPHYGIKYLLSNKKDGWSSLGGIVLCITGAEALYADLGHFSAHSIQIAFSVLVFPCLLLAYLGQAAFLMHHPEDVTDTFYKSLPQPLYWPVFVLATVSASIASQAIISATFSIIKQAMALGCFPRVKIVHTSSDLMGQVYIPEINWMLMILCLIITAGFRDTEQIGNAYGIAVVGVMLSTTILIFLVMIMVWHKNVWLAATFLAVFGTVEAVYYSAVLFKAQQGGWVPLAIAATMLTVMYVWHYGTIKRYDFEIQNKVSVGWVLGLGTGLGLVRVPGIGLVYTDLAHGVPPIFSHFITNLPAIHSTLVFVCIKYLPVNTVPKDERFHIKRIGPTSFSMFRCAARYGYMDLHKKDDHFEELLIDKLARYIKYEALEKSTQANYPEDWTPVSSERGPSSNPTTSSASQYSNGSAQQQQQLQDREPQRRPGKVVRFQEMGSPSGSPEESTSGNGLQEGRGVDTTRGLHGLAIESDDDIEQETLNELETFQKNKEVGIVYLLGNTVVRARSGSGWLKKIAINYVYAFLRRTCRESKVLYNVPHESTLQVGMVYFV
ncbi:hypothetical protein R1sor_014830 [Riccia sorocarpa]|uniref:Potassium transporter n=1 Tax=Riccia sorocarpa TaxID=122646 RepID=A0ABD3HCD3_9MARC